jgi:hypothetical protein
MVTDPDKIIQIMQEWYENTANAAQPQTETLADFLEDQQLELPHIGPDVQDKLTFYHVIFFFRLCLPACYGKKRATVNEKLTLFIRLRFTELSGHAPLEHDRNLEHDPSPFHILFLSSLSFSPLNPPFLTPPPCPVFHQFIL